MNSTKCTSMPPRSRSSRSEREISSSAKAVKSGELLFGTGRNPIACIKNHLHRLRRRTAEVVPEFVALWLQAAFLHFRVYGDVGNKTTIPNLSASRLKDLLVPQPRRGEQELVAAVLGALQRAVILQERKVARLKELNAATMVKLFHEGFRGEPPKQTEIGEIPRNWDVVPLSGLAELSSGGTPPKANSDYWMGSIPWLSPKDMKDLRLKDTI